MRKQLILCAFTAIALFATADRSTELQEAVYRDDLPAVQRLLAAGADVRAVNRYGVASLSLACTNGNGKMVEVLLKAGADPNTTLPGGETALMTAARTGKPEAVKALLVNGAKVNERESHGQTAIMWAAAEGHAEVVQMLVEFGANFRERLATALNGTDGLRAHLGESPRGGSSSQPRGEMRMPRVGWRMGLFLPCT